MLNPSIDRSINPTDGVCNGNPEIGKLNQLSIEGLVPMFNRDRRLFCHRLKRTESGLVQEGVSRRYTMMTLIGLQRCEEKGIRSPVDAGQVLDGMLENLDWIDNIGDLGLVLWTCAAIAPERLRDVSSGLDVGGALGRFREVREGRTMELAWFLSGLTHAGLARPEQAAGLRGSAVKTYRLLEKNQGDHGFFGHLAEKGSLSGRLRGHIGSFADQVYPICALAQFGRAYEVLAATEAARTCAEAICRAQGPLGQWWWHYDARNGGVFENYPVYSVHQHGMGPMALFAAEEAGLGDFTGSIYKGLRWIYGNNELGRDLRDQTGKIVWRNIYRGTKYDKYFNRVRGVLGIGHQRETGGSLNITWECRPYELGWLLYAFAGREGAACLSGPNQ